MVVALELMSDRADPQPAISGERAEASGGVNRPSRITDRKCQVTTLSRNERGHVSRIQRSEQTIDITHDACGRRIQSSITQGGRTSTVQCVYEGLQALGEIWDGRLSHRPPA